MSKSSGIERKHDIVILLNNDTDDIIEEDEKEERIKEKARREEQKLKETLHAKCDPRIIIKDRKNQTDDIYPTIVHYMKQNKFCVSEYRYIDYEDGDYNTSIYYSDFIIFINDGWIDRDKEIKSDSYKPMCIAFIKIYEYPVSEYKFLYINIICKDPTIGECGSFLMDTIKYVSTLLNCNEIRLDSVESDYVYEFYEKNGFIKDYPKVEYNHYYPIEPKDAEFEPATIVGEARINPQLDQDEIIETNGGKSTFKKSGAKRKTKKFIKSTFKKSGAKRKTKKSTLKKVKKN
jgi:hypothetical protein